MADWTWRSTSGPAPLSKELYPSFRKIDWNATKCAKTSEAPSTARADWFVSDNN